MKKMTEYKYTNRLAEEKSPYLLQHAHNPVNWYPWGDEAFTKAEAEDKPVFLSIGYSTCHWCHVMERESFEDEEVAEVLNKNFISIKVDREERPDIDHIHMNVCQALTGHGGWPLSLFLTPDRKPFFAGTYFPKEDRSGMTGFMTLLDRVADAWKNKRDTLLESGDRITDAISREAKPSEGDIPKDLTQKAYSDFKRQFESEYGGFGSAPKFPTPHHLYFLLRYWHLNKEEDALRMVEKTLDSMHRGGIYDHIGFGFSRYSTDRRWLVPHFEKMLYDNALLAIAYLEAYQATKNEKYAQVARQIFTYVLRDMTSPDGGFYSAEDADSEGEEGKFYVWAVDEVVRVLGDDDGQRYCRLYGITAKGNFEGHNIPNLINGTVPEKEKEFAERCRQKLFDYREKRIHPYKDDKILTAWNGLMIAALAVGSRVLGDEIYSHAAEKAVNFIYSHLLREEDGRLLARYRDGEAAFPAYLDDYTFLTWGLIELYEATYKPEYLQKAIKLDEDILTLFWDKENGGLFLYGSDSEQLIARPKEIYDGATPSGNSVAAFNFLRLARLTASAELEKIADRQFRAFGKSVERAPRGYSFFMSALLFSQNGTKEIYMVSESDHEGVGAMIDIIREDFRPFTVTMLYSDITNEITRIVPIIQNYTTIDGKATAYVCENYACHKPVIDRNEFREMLQS
jgi:uncharacterized protein